MEQEVHPCPNISRSLFPCFSLAYENASNAANFVWHGIHGTVCISLSLFLSLSLSLSLSIKRAHTPSGNSVTVGTAR